MKKFCDFLKNNRKVINIIGLIAYAIISLLIVFEFCRYANNYMNSNYGEWFVSAIQGSGDAEIYNSIFVIVFIMIIHIMAFVLYIVSTILIIVGNLNKNNICILLAIIFSSMLLVVFLLFDWIVWFKWVVLISMIIAILGYIGNILK